MTTEEKYRIAAREIYGDATQDFCCDVDSDAEVSVAKDGTGAWVKAWMWVDTEEIVKDEVQP